ncbi:DNA-binding protein [Bacillus sp. AFS076308]|uniref:helix-turn-helix domain-containing protein n=1 Tax=Bacillus sp. AFS076308 TaxID=2033512 RepID=UPI000BF57E8D|nr:helix-turn-helix domain-containing protein [Bacillus sp. AFS076308]PFO04671.1 DNA-binding protein [Bacillus sp. AFS076308]
MNEQTLPNILTAQHIANYLGISRRRVYELMQMSEEAGGIRCFTIGLSKRVDKDDFLQWIEMKKNKK